MLNICQKNYHLKGNNMKITEENIIEWLGGVDHDTVETLTNTLVELLNGDCTLEQLRTDIIENSLE